MKTLEAENARLKEQLDVSKYVERTDALLKRAQEAEAENARLTELLQKAYERLHWSTHSLSSASGLLVKTDKLYAAGCAHDTANNMLLLEELRPVVPRPFESKV